MGIFSKIDGFFVAIRRGVYNKLLDSHNPNNLHVKVENFVASLILLNLMTMFVEHIPEIYEPYAFWFKTFDHFSLTIFSVEYLLRLYVAPDDPEFSKARFPRLKYVTSVYALIDLSAILPFYLSSFIDIDLRMLRLLRLLRLLKLFRVLVPAYNEFMEINKERTFRQKIHALVWPSDHGGQLHHFFDLFIVFWVIISVLGVIFESVESIHYLLNVEFAIMDAAAVAVFSVEYIMRMYSCVEDPSFPGALRGRAKCATSPNAVIDFLAIIPFFLEAFLHHLLDLRFLRIFRMLRLLKLTRFTDATHMMIQVLTREWPVMAASLFVMMLVVVMTASLGYLFEHDAQPDKFENIPQSIYWAVITLTSVGYGDISPVTPMGRLITIGISVMGIAIVAIPAGILSAAFTDQLRIERETLIAELVFMLADGVIDDDERAIIDSEAKRLHIKPDEIDRLLATARKERATADHQENHTGGPLELGAVSANPDVALQQFRILVSQMNQVCLLADNEKLHAKMSSNDESTLLERSIWYTMLASRQASPTEPDPEPTPTPPSAPPSAPATDGASTPKAAKKTKVTTAAAKSSPKAVVEPLAEPEAVSAVEAVVAPEAKSAPKATSKLTRNPASKILVETVAVAEPEVPAEVAPPISAEPVAETENAAKAKAPRTPKKGTKQG